MSEPANLGIIENGQTELYSNDGERRAIFPLSNDISGEVLWHGEGLAETMRRWTGPAAWQYPATRENAFPKSGIHLDFQRKHVFVWGADSNYSDTHVLLARWPHWRIELGGDNYERHLALYGSGLHFPVRERRTLMGHVRKCVCAAAIEDGGEVDRKALEKRIREWGGPDLWGLAPAMPKHIVTPVGIQARREQFRVIARAFLAQDEP